MYLPRPPSIPQKLLYLEQRKALFYGWGLFSFLALLAGMAAFSMHHQYVWAYWLYAAVVAVYLGASYWIGIFGRPFDYYRHVSVAINNAVYMLDRGTSVDVYLPSCGEPLEILENTYRYVRQLDWPEGKLHVYVLDDSGRKEVKLLADRYEFEYISRPNRGELKKAGNIRYAFPQTHGDFILILDADFCPRPNMIREMIGYFWDDNVGIVQTPQFFEVKDGQTWIEKGAGYVQELFYRMVQVNRDTWGASICVGTCAMYRRKTLEPHGGTYPIAYSEDLHTGWQALVDGWKVKYIPLNLAMGVCPDTMSAYWIQQTRWCMGSTSLLTSSKFWKSKITKMQRLCYMSGMFYYIATALSVFLTPLPSLIVVWFFPENVFWYNYLFSIPSFLFGVLIVALWGRHDFGMYVLSARQVSYYAHLSALWEKTKGNIIPWVPTGNANEVKGSVLYLKFKKVMFVWVSVATALGFAGAFTHMKSVYDYDFYPMLFFTGFHYWVSMRCFSEEA